MGHHILVVEDEISAAKLLLGILRQAGYNADLAARAEEALEKIRTSLPDLLLLDLQLPGLSGLGLCRILKKDPRTASLPVIMVTTRKHEGHKVGGLETGADDYVTKPYSAKELLARIQALLRRVERQGIPKSILEAGGIRVDLEAHEVNIQGKLVFLRPKEYDLLVLFLHKRGRLLTHDFIADSLWGLNRTATSSDVKWWVHHLRKKLATYGSSIEAVTHLGYKFTAS